jgi:hypothetical protein
MQHLNRGLLAAHYFLPVFTMITIQHHGPQRVKIITGRYCDDNQLYVTLDQNGELYADLSVCLVGVPLDDDEFVFKTYGENQGLYQAMIDAEKIRMVRIINHSLGDLPVCRLT